MYHTQEQERMIKMLWSMPIINQFFSLWPELVIFEVLFWKLIIFLMNHYFQYYYVLRLRRQWRKSSLKQLKQRIQKI